MTCSFFVNNMKKVDAIEGTVELDFQLYAQWVDPALAGAGQERPLNRRGTAAPTTTARCVGTRSSR